MAGRREADTTTARGAPREKEPKNQPEGWPLQVQKDPRTHFTVGHYNRPGWESLRAFRQARFYDSYVYSQEKAKEKLHYIHANPVERKLVEHPRDWPWSSFLFYATGEPGLIAIDALNARSPGKL